MLDKAVWPAASALGIKRALEPGKVGVTPKRARFSFLFALVLITLSMFIACESEPRKTDAELGLTPEQAFGRRVYDARCAECHYAYSKRDLRGPSLNGLFKRQSMKNGIPANNERVSDIILLGRSKMPGFQQKLTPQQLAALLAYLHTL
jgi:mono/diheme cytochrome c family protein